MTKTTVLSIAALAMGSLLAGCSEEKPANNNTTEPVGKLEMNETTPVVFKNEKGEAVCPVMGSPMADTKDLKFQDYEGKRYYFCCDVCPPKFKAEPAKYADGKAMPAESKM